MNEEGVGARSCQTVQFVILCVRLSIVRQGRGRGQLIAQQ